MPTHTFTDGIIFCQYKLILPTTLKTCHYMVLSTLTLICESLKLRFLTCSLTQTDILFFLYKFFLKSDYSSVFSWTLSLASRSLALSRFLSQDCSLFLSVSIMFALSLSSICDLKLSFDLYFSFHFDFLFCINLEIALDLHIFETAVACADFDFSLRSDFDLVFHFDFTFDFVTSIPFLMRDFVS